jgi:hypothetical protein
LLARILALPPVRRRIFLSGFALVHAPEAFEPQQFADDIALLRCEARTEHIVAVESILKQSLYIFRVY